MAILRGEAAAPDKIQTLKSIRKNIEETYEVVEAIDNSDYTLLARNWGPYAPGGFPRQNGVRGRTFRHKRRLRRNM